MSSDDVAPLSFYGGIRYATRPEGPLLLDVLAPSPSANPLPVVIYFHGGGWHEGDRGNAMRPWLNPLLAARGFVTVSVTYRLSGRAHWPAQLDDAHDAVAWVIDHAAEFGGDPARVGIWGFSAGAHLAALVALNEENRMRAAALVACPADLRAMPVDEENEVTLLMGGSPSAAQLAEISPVCQVHASAPPMLIVHGTDDATVPFAQGVALRDALRSVGGQVEWHEIPGGEHDWADRPPAALDETGPSFGTLAVGFFEREL